MKNAEPGPVKVLFVASEVVPIAKTGGLADVTGTLPHHLKKMGYDVRVVLPYYRAVHASGIPCERILENIPVDGFDESFSVDVYTTPLEEGLPCYLLKQDEFYDRSQLYDDYDDNDLRFIYFARAVFSLCRSLPFVPDVFHCHDWQAALVPAYLRYIYGETPPFERSRSLLTIHNLAYQGEFPADRYELTGLPGSFFTMDGMEFWGKMSFLKAGIASSHLLNTVSPTYCKEILTSEYGCGLESILSLRQEDLSGILNGVDYNEWNPETDPNLPARYSKEDMEGKRACKRTLLREMGISMEASDAPLFGMISRLTYQKGLDLVMAASEEMVNLGLRCVILGDGEDRYIADCESLTTRFPDHFSVRCGFDIPLAHRIHAGCDFLLMPSRYEPCGLNQIHAMHYGTIPVVRATGGLKDTVEAYDAETGKGTGFLFDGYDPSSFLRAVGEAVKTYASGPEHMDRLRKNCMEQRYSWERSAAAYAKLYSKLETQK